MLKLLRFVGNRKGCSVNFRDVSSSSWHLQRHNGPTSLYSSCQLSTKTEATTSASSSTANDVDDRQQSTAVAKLKYAFNEDLTNGKVVPVYKRALLYGDRLAIKDEMGQFSYMQLYQAAKRLSFQLSNLCGSGSSARIAFLSNNSAVYTVIQWACWFSGQIAVPLSSRTPANLLDYYIKDSKAGVLVTVPEYEDIIVPLGHAQDCPVIVVDHTFINLNESADCHDAGKEIALQLGDKLFIEGTQENSFYAQSDAMILYTSGSTGQPKGTVITHRNIQAQVNSLSTAWQMHADDALLHVLPLNHVHGCVNGLILPLTIGAKVVMHPRFDSSAVWSTLLNVNAPSKDRVTVFMGVPTMYSFLIAEYDKVFAKNARMVEFIRSQCAKRIRLMVSGSAPLPKSVFNRWTDISGHKLLERYGMTEIGMALSNPYLMDKTRDRLPGTVGGPLPGTEVKLVSEGVTMCYARGEAGKGLWSEHEQPEFDSQKDEDAAPVFGELYVKGATVFNKYLDRPDETTRSFVNNWFATGDEAKCERGIFSIVGRKSVDIIKTGGHKVSALEIETHIMEHPSVQDVCVVGIADITWGQRIAALVVPKAADADTFSTDELREFCRNHLEAHQVPVEIQVVAQMPRNAMGKVNKKEIVRDFFAEQQGEDE